MTNMTEFAKAYESLWDSIIQQFMTHSAIATLSHAVGTIAHMLSATTLSATNSAKTQEFDEALAIALRDAVSGQESLETSSFSQDEIRTLESICSRIAILVKHRDMTLWMEDEDEGKQSSAWDIFSSILDRASLGYEHEEKVIRHHISVVFLLMSYKMMVDAMDVLVMHLIWKFSNMSTQATPADEEAKEKMRSQRDSLLDRLVDFVSGGQTNVLEGVKKAVSFICLSNNIHLIRLKRRTNMPSVYIHSFDQ